MHTPVLFLILLLFCSYLRLGCKCLWSVLQPFLAFKTLWSQHVRIRPLNTSKPISRLDLYLKIRHTRDLYFQFSARTLVTVGSIHLAWFQKGPSINVRQGWSSRLCSVYCNYTADLDEMCSRWAFLCLDWWSWLWFSCCYSSVVGKCRYRGKMIKDLLNQLFPPDLCFVQFWRLSGCSEMVMVLVRKVRV